MKVVVFGADGMLGSHVVDAAKDGLQLDVIPWTHKDLDITNSERVQMMITKTQPQVIINCAGIVKGRSESDEIFMSVNGLAPQMITELCDDNDIRMVQISTDHVFAGNGPYIEDDEPDATDIYGLSKIAGEVTHGHHLTIRCSFVGMGKRGLLAWLMKQTGTVPGYVNVLWNGLTVLEVAKKIVNLGCFRPDIKGIAHVFGHDTTKYHILKTANEVFKLHLVIEPVDTPMEDYRLRNRYLSYDTDIRTQLESDEFMRDYHMRK